MMKSAASKQALNFYSTFKPFRNIATSLIDRRLYKNIVEADTGNLKAVQQKKYEFLSSLLFSVKKNIDNGYISRTYIKNLGNFITNLEVSMVEDKDPGKDVSSFNDKYGIDPPNFIVLSPTQRCNLNCTGCYACSDRTTAPTLPFRLVDKIVGEVHDSFNSRFVTISGGEPFMYNDDGKTIFDIFEKYNDMFFLIYTNGTLINEKIASRLEKLGNVTPAISVEGYREHTDERRGKGTHDKILKAFENLRTAGVPFGVSATATSRNVKEFLKDEFYEYYFDEQGASYMWQFQFMPIGRGRETFDLVVSPEDRVEMFRTWERMLEKRRYAIADFWNSGLLTHGCVAYGANRGHIYIDWNGNIMPCVFVPYHVDNVYDLFKNGKSLGDALLSGFMRNGNNWQIEYGLLDKKKPGNWLMPCSIRDHYANFRKNIITGDAKGEDKEADAILEDKGYYENMLAYDEKLRNLTEEIWEKEYIAKG